MQASLNTDEAGFAWTITKDHTPELYDEEFREVVMDRTGEVWPDGMMIPWSLLQQSAEAIRNHPQGVPFRVFNSEGRLRFEGVLVGDISGLPAAPSKTDEPFHAICRGWAARVELFHAESWKKFEYTGFSDDDGFG